MAIARQLSTQLGTLTVASIALKADITEVEMTCPAELVDGRGIAWGGESENAVKQHCEFRTSALSTYSSPARVANIDVGAFTLAGTDFLTHLRGGSFNGSFHMSDELGGVSNYWSYKVPVIPIYSASVMLNLPNADTVNALRTFITGMMNATIATAVTNRNAALSITINSVAHTLAMIIATGGIKLAGGPSSQIVTLDLKGRNDGSSTYPTAPTGTTTLLEKHFNSFATPMAFTFTPKSANSTAFTGELVPTSFSFDFNDSSLIKTNYAWQSHGVVTATNN